MCGVSKTLLAGSLLIALSTPSAKAQTEGLFSPPPKTAPNTSEPFASPDESPSRLNGNANKAPEASASVDISDTVDLEAGGQTIRRRMARIDLAQLDEARGAVQAERGARLDLNLFGDSVFTAVDLRVAATITGYSISGRLEGVQFGTATLVANGDVVAGSVRTPETTFSIRSVGGGRVEIREVDPSKLPPGGEPLVPPPSALRSEPATEAAANGQDEKVIDVLVVYTPAAREEAGGRAEIETIIDLWVVETNQAYVDSGVDQAIHLVHAEEVDYTEQIGLPQDLSALSDQDGAMDNVFEMRDRFGADLVSLVTEPGQDFCGIAYLLTGNSSPATHHLSAVRLWCGGGRTFAHELGHNMGLVHDRFVDANNKLKIYPHAHGYVNQEAFKPGATAKERWLTIMAYPAQCGQLFKPCARLMRFSNPNQTHLGDAMGVPGDTETWALDGPADARRTLNSTRMSVGAYRPSVPILVASASIAVPGVDPRQSFTLDAEIHNRGRLGAGDVALSFHRSPDAIVTPEDEEVAAANLDEVAPLSERIESVVLTAPATGGDYWYGVCLDSDYAARRCSAPVRMAVGPWASITDASATEGDAMEFAVTLSEPRPDTDVTVHWRVSGDTAAESVDFVGGSGTLIIPAGKTSGTVVVSTMDDDVAEPEDAFRVSLVDTAPAAPRGVVLSAAASEAVGRIFDDDGALSIPDANLRMALAHALGKEPTQSITAEDLAGLAQLDWSSEARGSFQHEIADLTGLEFAVGLRSLDLTNNNLGDLSPLAHLPALTWLDLDANFSVTDVGPLAVLEKLRFLRVRQADVVDISALAGLVDLRALSLGSNEISDISALAGLVDLRTLELANNEISDISALRELVQLRVLDLNDNPVSDLSPLERVTRLQRLNARNASVADLSPLADLAELDQLDLSGNAISDVSSLKNTSFASGCMGGLNLSQNNLSDISGLADFVFAEHLQLNGNAISDIGPLSDLLQLTRLDLANNKISDIGPLSDLLQLTRLDLANNKISDIGPLANLEGLEYLNLGGNGISEVPSLSALESLRTLILADNAVSDIDALGEANGLVVLDLTGNRVTDISSLASLPSLSSLHLLDNPLGADSVNIHLPELRSRGVTVFDIALWIGGASAKEGDADAFRFPVYLSDPLGETIRDAVVWDFWGEDAYRATYTELAPTANRADLWNTGYQMRVTIPAGTVEAEATASSGGQAWRAAEDSINEAHETFIVMLRDVSFGSRSAIPDGVAFPEWISSISGGCCGVSITRNASQAMGLVVDPSGPSHDMLLFSPAGDGRRQGFVRVVNRAGRTAAHVEAFEEAGGDRGAVTLTLRSGATVHFNSEDLLDGNRDKGVHGGVGEGDGGDWRLKLWANDVDVLAYSRTPDGFLSSLHDTVPRTADGSHQVPIFNPGSNPNQVSLLRLANPGAHSAAVTVTGVDDTGASPGSPVTLTLSSGETRTITAEELERGTSLDGSLGDGKGKWRVAVASDRPILLASLLESATGHLTNLSTVPDNKRPGEGTETIHDVPLFLSAADRYGREGFVRVVNHGREDATLRVKAYDETTWDYDALALEVRAGGAAHFNSDDLEQGNVSKGLSGRVGAGEGDWRLEISGEADVDVLAYVRTADGFLSSVHDVVRRTNDRYEVPIFNPGSNHRQVSLLRLVNPHAEDAPVSVLGIDDLGVPRGQVALTVPAGSVRTFTAQELEKGDDGFSGILGDGVGKWRLVVSSERPLQVLSLLESQSPTRHLTNLSTTPPTLK